MKNKTQYMWNSSGADDYDEEKDNKGVGLQPVLVGSGQQNNEGFINIPGGKAIASGNGSSIHVTVHNVRNYNSGFPPQPLLPSFKPPRAHLLNKDWTLLHDQIHIFVETYTGKTIILQVETSATVSDVKAKIKAKEGLSIHHKLSLIFNGTQLEDGHRLADYNIKHGSKLHHVLMGARMHILVMMMMPMGKRITLEVKNSDTISDVKAKIEAKEGIPIHEQHLQFIATELVDDCTLADYKIKNGSHIVLTRRFGGWNI